MAYYAPIVEMKPLRKTAVIQWVESASIDEVNPVKQSENSMSKNKEEAIRKMQYEISRLCGEYILALSDRKKARAAQLKHEFDQASDQLRRLEQNLQSENMPKQLMAPKSKQSPNSSKIKSSPSASSKSIKSPPPQKTRTKLRGSRQPKK